MKKIRIGHVGTAHDHSTGKLACVKQFPDIFEVVGLVEDDDEKWELTKDNPNYAGLKRMSVKQMLEAGVDACMIEGYELDLIKLARPFVDNGIPLHIDKPAGGDIEELASMLSVAKKKEIPIQIAYMYRYNRALQDCFSRIESGELGDIFFTEATMNTDHDDAKRAWLNAFPGGIMFFLGCHMVDLVYHAQGLPLAVTPWCKDSMLHGVSSCDHTFAALEYPHGISQVRAVSHEINGYGRRYFFVSGSKGSYEVKPLESPLFANSTFPGEDRYNYTYRDMHVDKLFPQITAYNRYDAMMLDFARFVNGEAKNPFTYEYEYELQRLVLACCGVNIDFREPYKL